MPLPPDTLLRRRYRIGETLAVGRAAATYEAHDTRLDAPCVVKELSVGEAIRTATGATILSDTAWPGYEEIPRWIMAGYTQVFEEAYNQWDRPPDVMFVQGGVGGLVCAAANWAPTSTWTSFISRANCCAKKA